MSHLSDTMSPGSSEFDLISFERESLNSSEERILRDFRNESLYVTTSSRSTTAIPYGMKVIKF